MNHNAQRQSATAFAQDANYAGGNGQLQKQNGALLGTAVPRSSEVFSALSNQSAAHDELDQIIEELRSRLEPVTIASPTGKGSATAETAYSSQLANMIQTGAIRISLHNERLRDLLAALAI